MKARGERVYKPGGKKEWRVVFWTHDTIKPNRRQCSFSEAKYGKEAASLLSRAVLDYIDVKGVVPNDLHDPPILDPAKKELIEYYSALHESRRAKIKKVKNYRKSNKAVESIVPLYTLTKNQDHLNQTINLNKYDNYEYKTINNGNISKSDSPLSVTTTNNTESPNVHVNNNGEQVNISQIPDFLSSQFKLYNSFNSKVQESVSRESDNFIKNETKLYNIDSFQLFNSNIFNNIQDIPLNTCSPINIDIQSLINQTFQQMMYQSQYQLAHELSLRQIASSNKANIPFSLQTYYNSSNPILSTTSCLLPEISNQILMNKINLYSDNSIINIEKKDISNNDERIIS